MKLIPFTISILNSIAIIFLVMGTRMNTKIMDNNQSGMESKLEELWATVSDARVNISEMNSLLNNELGYHLDLHYEREMASFKKRNPHSLDGGGHFFYLNKPKLPISEEVQAIKDYLQIQIDEEPFKVTERKVVAKKIEVKK